MPLPIGREHMEFFTIESVSSGKVLDVPGFSFNDGALIQQVAYNGGANQHWSRNSLREFPRFEYIFTCRATGKVLDVWQRPEPPTPIVQWTLHKGENQRWRLWYEEGVPGSYGEDSSGRPVAHYLIFSAIAGRYPTDDHPQVPRDRRESLGRARIFTTGWGADSAI